MNRQDLALVPAIHRHLVVIEPMNEDDLKSFSKKHLECLCVTWGLKVPGDGWAKCGFSEQPKKSELIRALTDHQRILEGRTNLRELRQMMRRKEEVQAHLVQLATDLCEANGSFKVNELVDHIYWAHLRQYGSVVSPWKGNIDPYYPSNSRGLTQAEKLAKAKEDWESCVRSWLYEHSPSSCQYWFKGGEVRGNSELPSSGERFNGIGNNRVFINKALALRNAARGWTTKGCVRGDVWTIKEVDESWWDANRLGPVPTREERLNVEGRKQGYRGTRLA